jgi:hypothetical protein
VLLVAAVVLTAHPATTPAATPTSRAHTVRPSVVTETISPRAPTTRILRSFLGFSTEYWTLPVDERHTSLNERLLALVHVPGDGPFVLQTLGDSSDQPVWDQKSVAAFVRAAKALLPPGSIIGYAIGNELDLYTRAAWTSMLRGSS